MMFYVSMFGLSISSGFGLVSDNNQSNIDVNLNISKFIKSYVIQFSLNKKYVINNGNIESSNMFIIKGGINSLNSAILFDTGIGNMFNNKYYPVIGITSLYHFKYTYLQISLLTNIIFQNSKYYFTYPMIIIDTGISYTF